MRIVGGSLRGRLLTAPTGRDTRPTLDRVREALFNILTHASRWYEDDQNPLYDGLILDAYEQNIADLKLGDKTRVQRADATKPPRAPEPASMVFLDPPYQKDLLGPSITGLANAGWINDETLIIAERDPREPAPEVDGLETLDSRKYGRCQIDIYRLGAAS